MNAIKKIFKLIRLGVFCKWFTNVNKQPGLTERGFFFVFRFYLSFLFDPVSWRFFIGYSFPWESTKEGPEFWRNIMNK